MLHCGLDLHAKNSTYCLMTKRGRMVSEGEVVSSRRGFGRVLGESEGRAVRVVIETSTRSEWAAKTFESLGAEVVIIDARKIRVIAETKHKTDRTDARILADLARTDALPKPIWRADRDTRELRELVTLRKTLVDQRARLYCKARSLLAGQGIRVGARGLCSPAGWKRFEGRRELRAHERRTLTILRQAVEALSASIAEVESGFEKYLRRPEAQRLMQIPGIGPIVALTTLACLGDLARFSSSRAAAGYTGLVPSERSSGERRRRGRMTREGPADLRRAYIQAAQASLRMKDHPAGAWARSLVYRRGRSVAVVALARRLFRWAFAVLRDGTDFDTALVTTAR